MIVADLLLKPKPDQGIMLNAFIWDKNKKDSISMIKIIMYLSANCYHIGLVYGNSTHILSITKSRKEATRMVKQISNTLGLNNYV
jgi:hypothetical protein